MCDVQLRWHTDCDYVLGKNRKIEKKEEKQTPRMENMLIISLFSMHDFLNTLSVHIICLNLCHYKWNPSCDEH